ncbi:MAG: nuclear transport factor 2 family protein [Solirubrobacterales bacterium]|nr:nuclear transport factor 2 family protein [Solirubrobacterales bacterium]
MSFTTEAKLELIRRYYHGCSTGDIDAMLATLTPDVVHYFLDPNPGSQPVISAEHLARYWRKVQQLHDGRWAVDAIVGEGDSATIEWTLFWTPPHGAARVATRGAECYRFRDGRICEIRAYYQQRPERSTELQDFPYTARGYSRLGREVSDLHPPPGAATT